MTREQAVEALHRALEISRELAAIADGGDLHLTVSLDAERLQLLKFARAAVHPMDEQDGAVLREIAALNDRALGFLEHRRRAKGRDMDMVATGKRALRAYSSTQVQR
jgi:hypothetical protein